MTIQTIQERFGPEFLPFWKAVTVLGDGLFVFVVFAVLSWTSTTRLALRVGLVGVIIGVLVGFLKVAVREPRPYLIDPTIIPWQPSGGFGMPSGHAASAVGLFALLWLYRRGVWTLLLSMLAVLSVAVSRLYLGVHTWEQVVVGGVLGIAVVATFHQFGKAAAEALSRLSLRLQVSLAAFCCCALALTQQALFGLLARDFEIPQTWSSRAEAARKLANHALERAQSAITPTDLFEPHRVYLIALLFGMWLLGIAVGRGNSRERFDNIEKFLNVSIGSFTLFAVIATVALAREVSALPIVLFCATPTTIALGVPWLSGRLLPLVSRSSSR